MAGFRIQGSPQFTASPVMAGGMVFAAFGAGEHSDTQPFKHIQALDPTTGRVLCGGPLNN
jgi:hypothetical protein